MSSQRRDSAPKISSDYPIMTSASSLQLFSASLLVFSLFFSAWALRNSVAMTPPNFDYGIVSFGSVALTSTYLLALGNARVQPGSITRFLAIGSQAFVALNYSLGAYLGFTVLGRPGFGIYCSIFVLLWLGIAILASRLVQTTGSQSSSENLSLLE